MKVRAYERVAHAYHDWRAVIGSVPSLWPVPIERWLDCLCGLIGPTCEVP